MMLNQDPDQITRMEDDLRDKIQVAINFKPELNAGVYGVFSIDDLESKMQDDLGGGIGVGVQFVYTQAADLQARPGAQNARYLQFMLQVILAVPCGMEAVERGLATKLLGVTRQAIFGEPLKDDKVNRAWDFVREQAEPSASTATMLYYSQLWQVALPQVAQRA
jgi:hypothetical protein